MINNLVGEYTCDNCGKHRRTVFIKKGNGNIECVDCESDWEIEEFNLVTIDKKDSHFNSLLIRVYYEYLVEDMDLFYKIISGNDVDFVEMFVDGGTLRRDALMFYNNDYDFVEYMRTLALTFRETITDDMFDDLSLKWIKRYLELRERVVDDDTKEMWYLESDIDVSQLYSLM